MKKASRTRVRLGKLPHHVLADLLSSILERGTFGDAQALVDLNISKENPLPDWAVQGVLVSRDLAPKILKHIELDNCAAAIVCNTWNNAWKTCHGAYFLNNKQPVQMPTSFNEVEAKQGLCTKMNSSGATSIVLRRGDKLYDVADATSTFPTFKEMVGIKELDSDYSYERSLVAAHKTFTYAATPSTIYKVCEGVKVKEVNAFSDSKFGGSCVRIRQILCFPKLGHVLVLVCDADSGNDHVRVFDEDLNYLYSFSEEEKDCQGMAIIHNRLYLCLTNCDQIERYNIINGRFAQDFSHEEDEGEWSQPLAITSAEINGKFLIYLVEQRNNDNRPDDEEDKGDRGQCLIVMDSEFNVLHRIKFLHNEEYFSGDIVFHNNCIFCTTEEEKENDKVRNVRIFRVANIEDE